MPDIGQEREKEMKEMVTRLQGKSVREMANRLMTGNFKIEKEAINRYRVYEAPVNNVPEPAFLIDRRSFVLLDKELYKLQARENPLAACIELALNNNALHFCVRKASIDAMNAKLIAKTFTQAKVTIVDVSTYRDNYIIRFELIESVSERALTEKEQAIFDLFKNAQEVNLDPESLQLPAPETTDGIVDTTAKVIPEK